MDEFIIARNPDSDSTLPFLVRLPLGPNGVVLKVRDTWPRTAKVYCHASTDWPTDPDIVERVLVRDCVRRGAAIDLVLDRGRENRSQFVFTRARGREVIFWQSARTAKQARPNVATPTRRASGLVLDIVVDSHERYPWRFVNQQATTTRRALRVGDYAIELDGELAVVVERKSLADLVSTISGGKMRSLLAALATVPRSALVVEDRYSQIFKQSFVQPGLVAESLAEAQARFPTTPIVFCETRALAEEWTYRYLGASVTLLQEDAAAGHLVGALPGATAPEPAPATPTAAAIRAWARAAGMEIGERGRIPPDIRSAFHDAPLPATTEP